MMTCKNCFHEVRKKDGKLFHIYAGYLTKVCGCDCEKPDWKRGRISKR